MVNCNEPEQFPERIDHTLRVNMTMEYYDRYVKLVQGEKLFGILFTDPDAFYNGYRRAVNRAGPEYYSRKIEAALPILKKGHSVIYTNWVDFGIRPIVDALKTLNISYRIFSGDISLKERLAIIDDFNAGKFDVLILTKAGGEGIDLKGVRSVVVLDPTWNDAALQQVIGRSIRYKSHAHLSRKERKVDVYFMVLIPPENIGNRPSVASGDELLYNIIEKKNKTHEMVTNTLKELSI
jgi:superfamily II DNA or RNA helicase